MTATIVHYIDTSEFGGAERSLLHLLGALDRARFRSVLLHPDESGLEPLVAGAHAAGVETRVVPFAPGLRGGIHIPHLRRAIASHEAAVFHAHLNWPLACTAGILAAAWQRVPAIVATVQLFSPLPGARSLALQARIVTRSVGRYVAVSRSVAHRMHAELGVPLDRIDIVHNGLPIGASPTPDPEVRREMAGGCERPVVLALARLHPQKGLATLLRAAAELSGVAFAIAGDGPERQALESEARHLGIADRISFLGFRRDTAFLLASADAFVLPSEYEGLPLALLEAMAAGTPVVAAAIPGVDEVVTDGVTGLLFPAGDADALARSIRRVVADAGLANRLADNGAAHVRACFTAERMAGAVMETYERLLARTNGLDDAGERTGRIAFGDLRRTTPFSRVFGFDRGAPVDRHYIEGFLAAHASDIRGRVLEVKDAAYTRRFGGGRVTMSDVLDIDASNRDATIIDDLTSGEELPSNSFDCVLLTQTLHLIFDAEAAVRTIQRVLKPGGVLLLTVPGITQIPRAEAGSWYWSFSEIAVATLVRRAFAADEVEVRSYGNVLAATAFLYGLAAEELRVEELDAVDPDYPVTVAVRAVKAEGSA